MRSTCLTAPPGGLNLGALAMKSRSFIGALAVAFAFFALTVPTRSAESSAEGRQYYELRVYTTANQEQQELVNEYWRKAGVPAYNRAGIKPIGVFTENKESATNKIYVLIPYDSLGSFEAMGKRLEADDEYQTAAADFMNRTKNNAPYARMDTSLLLAMSGMPELALPPSSADKSPWIFELRTYLSPTEAKGANKIEMFNAGEIEVMKEVGLNPVFFAGTVAGPQMPSLVYMNSGPDMEKYRAKWRGFGPHPVWKKLLADAKYKDNMSGIQSVFLKRTSASEI